MLAILVLYTYGGIHILPGRRNVDFSWILIQRRRKRNTWYIFLPSLSSKVVRKNPLWSYTYCISSTYIAISFVSIFVYFLLFYCFLYPLTSVKHILMLNICKSYIHTHAFYGWSLLYLQWVKHICIFQYSSICDGHLCLIWFLHFDLILFLTHHTLRFKSTNDSVEKNVSILVLFLFPFLFFFFFIFMSILLLFIRIKLRVYTLNFTFFFTILFYILYIQCTTKYILLRVSTTIIIDLENSLITKQIINKKKWLQWQLVVLLSMKMKISNWLIGFTICLFIMYYKLLVSLLYV